MPIEVELLGVAERLAALAREGEAGAGRKLARAAIEGPSSAAMPGLAGEMRGGLEPEDSTRLRPEHSHSSSFNGSPVALEDFVITDLNFGSNYRPRIIRPKPAADRYSSDFEVSYYGNFGKQMPRPADLLPNEVNAKALEDKLKDAGIETTAVPLCDKAFVRPYLESVGRSIYSLCADDTFRAQYRDLDRLDSNLRFTKQLATAKWAEHLQHDAALREKYREPPDPLQPFDFLYQKPEYRGLLVMNDMVTEAWVQMRRAESSITSRIKDTVHEPLGRFTKAAGIPDLHFEVCSRENRPKDMSPTALGWFSASRCAHGAGLYNFERDGFAAIGVTYHELKHAEQATTRARCCADILGIKSQASPGEMKDLRLRMETIASEHGQDDFLRDVLRIRDGHLLSPIQSSRATILLREQRRYATSFSFSYSSNVLELEANLAMLRAEMMALESPAMLK